MSNKRDREPAEPSRVVDGQPSKVDPEVLTEDGRRRNRIADHSREGISIDAIPKPLVECGCEECGDMVDPLDQHDGGGGFDWSAFDSNSWAQSVCPEPQPVTIERAGEVFRRYAKSEFQDDTRTSKSERALSNYRSVMERDRYAREEYGDSLTTVMLSFRVQPTTWDGGRRKWLEPMLLADALLMHRSKVHRRIMNIRNHVDDLQYVWVVTGTERYATPHYHVYLWCDDPDNDVRPFDFASARNRHIDGLQASKDGHPIDPDGQIGSVTIRHTPNIADTETGTTVETKEGQTLDVSSIRREVRRNSDEPYREATKGAIYVASQLPYLCALNDDPHPADCQSAAIKWCHSSLRERPWFGSSQL